ncbi:MAG: STT3 domain-containing protein [Methanomassiliicoccales archaeon]|jgi:dolichyl-diphosphooligosaccharide--protein glycosyltransferase
MAMKKGGKDTTPVKEEVPTISTKTWLKNTWVVRNWQTTMILVMVILLAFFVRAYFAYPLSVDNGFLVSGGSDSYYHLRVINHVVDNGQHLVYDFSLNYPFGMRNARPPLYDWSVAVSGLTLNALGMSVDDAVGYSLVFSTAIWGALTVIPVYMMTNSIFGRKAGLLAAFLFSLMPGNIERTIFSNADHDAMVLFFVVFSFYFFMRALQSIRGTKWVTDWKKGGSIASGLRSYFKQNQVATLYAALAGVCVAAVSMIWTGYTYILIIILVYYILQLFIDRFKGADSTGVFMNMVTMWLIAFAVMAPLYYQMNYWDTWFDMPVTLFAIGVIAGLVFISTRDYPWVIMIPVILAIAAAAMALMYVIAPGVLEAVMSGQGYLVKSKLYSTISEAQAPDFSTLVMSFGALTFWLALFGVGYAAVKIPKSSNPHFVFIVVYGAVSIYMAASAGRFLFNATPAFALLGGWVLAMIIDWVKYDEYFKSILPVIKTPKQLFRKLMNGRVVIVSVLLVLLLIIPNAWTALDAAIPSEEKDKYDAQIYNFIPEWLRPADYESSWYLGAFSYSLPLPETYWPTAWEWFSEQDNDTANIEDKPAFVSWWDYGFEAIEEGEHPTVADNFQNGYQFAALFMLSQNESQAISMMITRVVQKSSWDMAVVNSLESYDIDSAELLDIITNPANYVDEILDHPELYGNYDSDLSAANAMYIAASYELTKYSEETLVSVYHDLMEITDIDIGYFAIDARLFPFNAYTQNIFYAPVSLSDQLVDDETGDCVDYYTIYAIDYYGNYYTLDEIPEGTSIYGYQMVYTEKFYDSMLYRAFMGYGPSDVGLDEQGIPGISGSLEDYDSMQAWNMTHFRMVYRTAYFNPYTDFENHTDEWVAISYDQAIVYQALIDDDLMNGTVDMSSSVLAGGVVFLQYYEGVTVHGQVLTEDGDPMEGIWVTASDEYGTPHDLAQTDENGYYSVILPFGDNVTVTYSYGKLDLFTLTATVLDIKTYVIKYEQAMHLTSSTVSGLAAESDPDWIINETVVLPGANLSGKVFLNLDNDNVYDETDILLEGATVYVQDTTTGYTRSTVAVNGTYSFTGLLPMVSAKIWAVYNDHVIGMTTKEVQADKNTTVLLVIDEAKVSVTVQTKWGSAASNIAIDLIDDTTGEVITKMTDSDGYVLFDQLLEGNYTLRANNTDFTLGARAYVLDAGEVVAETLVLHDAMTISGQVTKNSVAVPYAKVAFMTEEGAIWTTADANGYYSVVLPKTNYTIYALAVVSGEESVALVKTTSTADVLNVNLALSKAVITEGTVLNGNKTVESAVLTLTSSTGAIFYGVSNVNGTYRLALPAGDYTLHAVSSDMVFWDTVTAGERINVSIVKGAVLTGYVWSDVNGDAEIQTGELRANVTVTLTSINGTLKTVTSTKGVYKFVVPTGLDCQLAVTVPYYDAISESFTNVSGTKTTNLKLVGTVRDVSGNVELGGSGLASVSFMFQDNGGAASSLTVLTDSDGNYAVKLRPGNYKLVMEQDVTEGDNDTQYQFVTTYYLNISVGQSAVVLDMESVIRYKVTGTIAPGEGTISFVASGGDSVSVNTTGSYSVYLREGNYSLYALLKSSGNRYAVFQKVNVTEPAEIDLTATAAKGVTMTMKHNGATLLETITVIVTDESTGATYITNTTAKGVVTIYMPEGNYSVTADHRTLRILTGETQAKYVRYIADQTISFDETLESVSISLTMSYDNSTVNGLQPGTEYHFDATSGSAISSSFTVASSSVELAPGNYSVYAVNATTHYSFLGTIVVVPYVVNDPVMTLLPGISLNGTIEIGGNAVPGVVTVWQGDAFYELETDANGTYQMWLPAGTYTVNASAEQMDSGVTVTYSGSAVVVLSGAKVQDITLTKVVEYSVSLTWDADKGTVAAGESVTYSVRVRNTGNTMDSYILNATAKGWNISISKIVLSNINYGANGWVNVTVTLTPDSTIEVDHTPVVLTVKSTTGSGATGKLALDANISPSYDVNVTYYSTNDQTATVHTYKYLITNTGNIDDKYTIDIANVAEINGKGWNVTLRVGTTGSFSESLNITLNSGNYRYVEVSLAAIGDDPDPNVNITLRVQSQGNTPTVKELSLAAVFPTLTIPDDGLDVEGSDVVLSLPEIPAETYVAFTAIVLLAALVIYFVFKKGVLGRRK